MVLFIIAAQVLKTCLASNRLARFSAALLALAIACTKTVWDSTSYAEVYPLSFLLAALLAYLLWRVATDALTVDELVRHAFLACFIWGLGLGNHLTLIWYFPLVAYLTVRALKSFESGMNGPLWFLCAIALGASVNLFLPIRSAANPPLDWGNPETFEGLLRHMSAWQYRIWMFTADSSTLFVRFTDYLKVTLHSLGLPLAIFTALGVVTLALRRTAFLLVLLLTWVCGVFYNLNYDIPDIHTYDLLFYPAVFLFALAGLSTFVTLLRARAWAEYAPHVIVGLTALALVFPVLANYESANHRTDRFARTFSTALLQSLPDSAVVLQGNWDIQSPVLYLQRVETLRTDVTMLDLNLLQRSWYIAEQSHLHPELFNVCAPIVEIFLEHVQAFERGEPFDGQAIEDAFVDLNNCIIDNARFHRPVYIRDTQVVNHPAVGAGFPQQSTGYFVRIMSDSAADVLELDLLNPKNISFNLPASAGEARLREEAALSMIAAAEAARLAHRIALAESASVCAGGFDPSRIELRYLNRNIDIDKTRWIVP
jgi:hypothetical protein